MDAESFHEEAASGVEVIPVEVTSLQVARRSAPDHGESRPPVKHPVVMDQHNVTWVEQTTHTNS